MKEKVEITKMLLALAVTYAMCLVVANIIAVKIFRLGPMILPAVILVFPVVYIISDLMTEVYGFKVSLFCIKLNLVMNLLLVLLTQMAIHVPAPSFYHHQSAIAFVFGFTPKVVAASLLSYYCSDWINSAILSRMKVLMDRRWFGVRAVTSTLLAAVVDSIVFIGIVFHGVFPFKVLLVMMASQTLFKVGYETVSLPVTVRVVRWWKRKEGVDVLDAKVKYTVI